MCNYIRTVKVYWGKNSPLIFHQRHGAVRIISAQNIFIAAKCLEVVYNYSLDVLYVLVCIQVANTSNE